MIYLTFNDAPSGIYSSQVIDVVRFLNNNFNIKVRLVAFISVRNYFQNRRKIKNESPTAIILPMVPILKTWAYNKWLFYLYCIFFRPQSVIARNTFAAEIALDARRLKLIKKYVTMDGELLKQNVMNTMF